MSAAMGAFVALGVDASSATSTEGYEITNPTFRLGRNLIDAAGLRGTRSHISERVRQNTIAPGFSFTMQPNSVELDLWLPRILGAAEIADAFALAETLPTFVANFDLVSKRWPFTGCKVNKATFKSSQGQPLDLMLDCEALSVTPSATALAAVTISTVGPYIFSDAVISVGGNSYSFREWELTIDNQLLTDRFFNSTTRASLPEQDRVITWTLSGPYGDNSALYGLSSAGVACVATFTLGARSLAFTSNKVAFPEEPPTVAGRGEVMLPLTGIARKDASVLELTTVNDSSP